MAGFLPTDIDSFALLQSRAEYIYIDKTREIADMLAESGSSTLFLSRPRRFGKTLLISILESLFQGDQQSFAGTWLGQPGHWDWTQPEYPVIRLNMAMHPGGFPDGTWMKRVHHTFRRIQTQMKRLYRQFSIPLPDPDDIADLLGHLIYSVRQVRQCPVVVLIDEYDAPITMHMEHPDAMQEMLDLMRAFYGVLKTERAHIHFTFMTGITRIDQAGLFSGANHFWDLSMDPACSTLLGYTRTDMHDSADLMASVAQCAHNLGCSPQECLDALEQHYNGYLFAPEGETVCNPFSLNACLGQLQNPASAKPWKLDNLPNYWARSGQPWMLFAAWRRNLDYAPSTLLQTDIDRIEKACLDVASPDLFTLIYQSGYLTRKQIQDPDTGERKYVPDYPNREVEITYLNSFQEWLEDQIRQWQTGGNEPLLTRHLREAVRKRSAQDISRSVNTLQLAIPHGLHLSKSSAGKTLYDYEVYCHERLYTMLRMAVAGELHSELDAGRGRLDLALRMDNHILIFELKVNGDAEQAGKQVLARMYPAPWQDGTKAVTIFGLNFDSGKCILETCVKWDLGFFDIQKGKWDREPFTDHVLEQLRGLPTPEARDEFVARQTVRWHEKEMPWYMLDRPTGHLHSL